MKNEGCRMACRYYFQFAELNNDDDDDERGMESGDINKNKNNREKRSLERE